jgi:hypothetical protein
MTSALENGFKLIEKRENKKIDPVYLMILMR